MDEFSSWNIVEKYFKDHPENLIRHHLDSYNQFFKEGIYQIFKDKEPITIYGGNNKLEIYIGGKTKDRIYFGTPIIYDGIDNVKYMWPNEARLRNMTYGMTIHYDVDIITTYPAGTPRPQPIPTVCQSVYPKNDENDENDENGDDENDENDDDDDEDENEVGGGGSGKNGGRNSKRRKSCGSSAGEDGDIIGGAVRRAMPIIEQCSLSKVFLGRFPIMLQSDFCLLGGGLPREMRFHMGECRNDYGGYFIIDGKEKVIIPQEKFGDNMLYTQRRIDGDKYLYTSEIRSVSENPSKPRRTLRIGIQSPTSQTSFKNIVVEIPNVRKPIPLFILFRALGIISDKEIIQMCLLDLNKYEFMLESFRPSVYDGATVQNQMTALSFISTFTKGGGGASAGPPPAATELRGRSVDTVLNILHDYFLPHIGETNFKSKAHFLGYMTMKLLCVYHGIEKPTDRDNYKYKRVESPGVLISDLFREYFDIQHKDYTRHFDRLLFFGGENYNDDLINFVLDKHVDVFKERPLEIGFRRAFKGNWGSKSHTRRVGVVQDLARLSYNSAINHLRKICLPIDATLKIVGPRLLNCTHWGIIDPLDTPDGGNIGLHKHLAITTRISSHEPRDDMIKWIIKYNHRNNKSHKDFFGFIPLENDPGYIVLSENTKVFINGCWIGIVYEPFILVKLLKANRRRGSIPMTTSVTFDIPSNIVSIFTDSGRLTRPVFFRKDRIAVLHNVNNDNNNSNNHAKVAHMSYHRRNLKNLSWEELTKGTEAAATSSSSSSYANNNTDSDIYIESEQWKTAVIDYMDTNEEENALIALSESELGPHHTHMEIHKSLIFGFMCSMIVFPENNAATRNSFSCGQSKQAVSMYHTNYQVRMDKMGVVLNNGQVPLIKTRYLELFNREENTYGSNAIVAVMSYTGYNVEDAILINEGSVKRGIFQTSYYTTYDAHEQGQNIGNAESDLFFTSIDTKNVLRKKEAHDYSNLDSHGIIREGTSINDKTILMGMASPHPTEANTWSDSSITTKKGQIGIIDKSFLTDSIEGRRIGKVRVLEQRIPAMGDKFASRSGQKGTIGLVIPEADMPFTKDGLRPDIIINPHCLPSRQTVNQLLETLVGKACLHHGGFGDGTAYMNNFNYDEYGHLLQDYGYNSTGNEVLYNGMTGEQIETDIFIGPTYYMRLKHMVKDKINYRARGPNMALTRQPVQGRANDGGLRVGEMEAHAHLGHGMSEMLTDAMMNRSDEYYIAICNQTGMLAIYHAEKDQFFSPTADGPLKFIGSETNNNDNDNDGNMEMNVEMVSRFGRDFSVVRVPFAFKLLLQELQTLNVNMRLITDESSMRTLETMNYSSNMYTVSNTKTPEELIAITQSRLLPLSPFMFSIKKPYVPPVSVSAAPHTDDEKNNDDDNNTFFTNVQSAAASVFTSVTEEDTAGVKVVGGGSGGGDNVGSDGIEKQWPILGGGNNLRMNQPLISGYSGGGNGGRNARGNAGAGGTKFVFNFNSHVNELENTDKLKTQPLLHKVSGGAPVLAAQNNGNDGGLVNADSSGGTGTELAKTFIVSKLGS